VVSAIVFLGVDPAGSLTGFSETMATTNANGEFDYGTVTAYPEATFNLSVLSPPGVYQRQDYTYADIAGSELVVDFRP
jgi:hypothetical protein